MQVFYFDWLFVESALNQDRFPGCVIHVSHIFEGVEPHHLRVTGITAEVLNSVSCVSRKVFAGTTSEVRHGLRPLRQGRRCALPLHPSGLMARQASNPQTPFNRIAVSSLIWGERALPIPRFKGNALPLKTHAQDLETCPLDLYQSMHKHSRVLSAIARKNSNRYVALYICL